MNEHEKYMQDFLSIFDALDLWGPNSEADTTRAFELLEHSPKNILEIGCGNGNTTILLAKLSHAHITAIDNESSALDRLEAKMDKHCLSDRVSTECISMSDLKFDNESFDIIWAEASTYIMGTQKALSEWKPLLNENGVIAFSDLIWLTDSPDQELSDFWKSEYPDMQSLETRLAQIDAAGYKVEHSFTVSEQAWHNYYKPLQNRLDEVKDKLGESQAFLDIQKEIIIYDQFLGQFGYQFFIARKR